MIWRFILFFILCILHIFDSTHLALGRPITFDDAVNLAQAHPMVKGAFDSAKELREAAEKSPALDLNPVVFAALGPRVAPENERGVEATVGFSQSFSLEKAASRRQKSLRTEARWLFEEASGEALTRKLSIAFFWLNLWELEKEMQLAENDVLNETELLHLIERLQKVRERTLADVAVVQVRVTEAELRKRTVEGNLVVARQILASEIGEKMGDELATRGEPPALEIGKNEQKKLIFGVEELPETKAKYLFAQSEKMRALEDRATRGTRISLGLDIRRDALSATVFSATASLSLPLFDVGAREYAFRHSLALRYDAEAKTHLLRANSVMATDIHELEHSDEVFVLVSKHLLPSAELAASLRGRELSFGEATLLDVIDARRTLVDARVQLVRASRDRFWARIKLAYLLRIIESADDKESQKP